MHRDVLEAPPDVKLHLLQHTLLQHHTNHNTQVGRILDQIGWTLQKPAECPTERDEKAIEAWRTERWEELKKPRRKIGRLFSLTKPVFTY